MRTVLDDVDAAAVRATTGAGTSSVALPIAQADVTGLVSDIASKATTAAVDAKAPFGGLPIIETTIATAQTIGATQRCVTFGAYTVGALITVNGTWIALTQLQGI